MTLAMESSTGNRTKFPGSRRYVHSLLAYCTITPQPSSRLRLWIQRQKAGAEIMVNNGDITISVLAITGKRSGWASRRHREFSYIGRKFIIESFKQPSPRRNLKRTLPESYEDTR